MPAGSERWGQGDVSAQGTSLSFRLGPSSLLQNASRPRHFPWQVWPHQVVTTVAQPRPQVLTARKVTVASAWNSSPYSSSSLHSRDPWGPHNDHTAEHQGFTLVQHEDTAGSGQPVPAEDASAYLISNPNTHLLQGAIIRSFELKIWAAG